MIHHLDGQKVRDLVLNFFSQKHYSVMSFLPGNDVHEELTYNLGQADGRYEKRLTKFHK
jgi:hypothetical protein